MGVSYNQHPPPLDGDSRGIVEENQQKTWPIQRFLIGGNGFMLCARKLAEAGDVSGLYGHALALARKGDFLGAKDFLDKVTWASDFQGATPQFAEQKLRKFRPLKLARWICMNTFEDTEISGGFALLAFFGGGSAFGGCHILWASGMRVGRRGRALDSGRVVLGPPAWVQLAGTDVTS